MLLCYAGWLDLLFPYNLNAKFKSSYYIAIKSLVNVMRNSECREHMWKVLGNTLEQTAAFLAVVVVGFDRRSLGQLELTHDPH